MYAVGDIHGMDGLLEQLVAAIEADAAASRAHHTVVFLGDAVNRGPQTRQVLDRLIAGPANPANRWIVLRGNHEQAMLDALLGDDPRAFGRWLKRGGRQTLASYGAQGSDTTPAQARALIGPAHLKFLASLPLLHIAGRYLFTHAGVAPGVPLGQQTPETLMTIRGPFLRKRHGLPYTVVHGHTPTDGEPLCGPDRIGVDTGACVTGVLTAVGINQDVAGRRFLSVRAGGQTRWAT
jgi:serine/threonine protein phosphatase 1